jgi:PKD repeat protein
MPFRCFGLTRISRLRTLALASVIAIAGCSNSGHRTSESATPTSSETGTSSAAIVDRSGPGIGGPGNSAQDVSFPPRNEPFDFRLRLETQYQSVLRRGSVASFVDIEGTIVWTQEYLRYRVNGCSHLDAIARVTAQILGQGVQPVCADFSGTTVNFPPRDQPFAFRQELERLYRDVLRRGAVQTFVDPEGDIVWTQEYLRYRVNSCSHTEAVDRVLAQTLGAAVQPTCTGPITSNPGGGGGLAGFVQSVSAPAATTVTTVNNPRPNAGAGPTISVANAGSFSPGGTTQITLVASAPVSSVFVSANNTPGSSSLRPLAATDQHVLLTFNSPQTTIPLAVTLPSGAPGRFALEFGGSQPGGQPGNFAQLLVSLNNDPTCTFALLNGTTNFATGGGQGSVNVSVQAGCGWQLSSNVPWLTFPSPSGAGSAGVVFNVAGNTGAARSGRITVTGSTGGSATFDVNQAGVVVNPCSYSVSTNTTNFNANGGPLSVTVTTGAGCGWSASSLAGFISASGNTTGSGTGTATFNVASNSTTSARSGSVRVSFTATGGSQDVGINQSGQTVAAPVAIILNPSVCAVNTSCAFNGSTSQGQITSWDWDFGDGTSGSGPMVSHTYPTSFTPAFTMRVVSVRLTVTGPGGSHSATSTVTVSRSY